jgi:predicted signal transduction protein with EAL and GGDEF domain/FixJ family two-component response regulator
MTDPRRSILVVDDDAGARLTMRAALTKAGYEVRTADGGEDALRQFRATPSDMVMLDVEMPDRGGHEVCAILRSEVGPLLPIVMVTGMDDIASVEAAYEHGATDFIAKPVNWALLGHRVRYLFRSHQALVALRAEQDGNAAVLSAIPDLLFELDLEGRCLDYRLPRSTGMPMPPQLPIGATVHDTLSPAAAQVILKALQAALEHGFSSGHQFELLLPEGVQWYELSVSRKAMQAPNKPSFIVLSRNVTERKRAEIQIASMAYFDSLTGLPNRQSFLARVERELHRAARKQRRLAVLFMDLDGFKNVNDTMGHASGDLLLQQAAQRLRDALRPSDVLSRTPVPAEPGGPPASAASHPGVEIARLGGDEFTALLLDIERPEDAMTVARRIRQIIGQPLLLQGREVRVSASVGIALYPEDGEDSASLLKHADTAMYHAKSLGRDNVQMYRTALTDQIRQRMDLVVFLHRALDNEEFHLVYQPQIDVGSGRIQAVEALLRWTHPVRGPVPPAEFIPLAEEHGLIKRIGLWVLRTACAQAARWNAEGLGLKMAVNLSPLQFGDGHLPHSVIDALAQTGLAPQHLELEVTEGALITDSAATRAELQALRDHGVHTALDDFGTGYSSLAYLTRMPISTIKIDRCFVAGLLDGGQSQAIIRAVLAMAHSLGMYVTAEGVETAEQAAALTAMGCDGLQGTYFCEPAAARDIPALMAASPPPHRAGLVPRTT